MKNTLLITLLGTAISLTAPSLSFADNKAQFKGQSFSHQQHKLNDKKSRVISSKTKKHIVKKHNNKAKSSFIAVTKVSKRRPKHTSKYRAVVKKLNTRLSKQAKRIRVGLNKGQLVKRELRKLNKEQRVIKKTLNHYKRDGFLNRYEQQRVSRLLDVASKNIYKKRNNHKVAYKHHYVSKKPHNTRNYSYVVQF